ncbi:MAG: hypothetical protein Q7S92_01425, partial [Candidatus Diapherotrites archaeon]|nr:hypothetical protein [Candidatus Diapherotrites archaeon]
MSLFTKKQLEIANSLIQPKTLDELIQLHDLQKELLEKELEKLEKFNLIEKQGNTFVLKKNIAE